MIKEVMPIMIYDKGGNAHYLICDTADLLEEQLVKKISY